jgi:hypothetical protein
MKKTFIKRKYFIRLVAQMGGLIYILGEEDPYVCYIYFLVGNFVSWR